LNRDKLLLRKFCGILHFSNFAIVLILFYMKLYFILIWIVAFSELGAQVQFEDRTAFYNINHFYGEGTAGGGVSMADFTGDGLDDLTLAASDGSEIYFFENTGNGLRKLDLLPFLKEEVKHLLWVDFDNDGDKDLFVALADNYNRLFVNNGQLMLEDKTESLGLPTDIYTSFGACFGDYNRDGWLDLYVGVRRIERDGLPNISRLFANKGGFFEEVTISSGTEDGGKTPFCSSFIDYNNDKWPDIYTAHDRRRGNTMLRNNKNGTFTDVSVATGTELKMDGMSVSNGDFNNDGFLDIYVSNSEAGNALFVNQQGTKFKNQALERGVAFQSVAWGTNFLDGDNDGDLDLYVSGMLPGRNAVNSQYYVNLFPGEIFIKGAKITSDTASSFNNAVGDLNNDGYPDLAVINVGPWPSFVFINKGGANNYVKIRLQGVLSNREGIGATIKAYHGFRKQFRYTSCGIGFMGQNSDTEIIGMGNASQLDSVIVVWPTGHTDRFYNLTAGTTHILKEGSTTGFIQVDPDVELLQVNTDDPVSGNENSGIKIWPNPVSEGILYVAFPEKAGSKEYSFFEFINTSGQLVFSGFVQGEAVQTIHTDHFDAGLYILKATSGATNYFKKLIVLPK